eukprot:GFUD01011761.1.p1 GENE.GFUD01011761.1~~GFUD01011761.1.p1  ORF type:complete len:253 (+),score=104.89 GFUD01011761.1:125-883(+)
MFKQKIRKSRKNILSLIEAAQTENEESEKKKTGYKIVKKKEKKQKKYRKDSGSPRDEGYNTGNEKIYATPFTIEDDFDQGMEGWEVETDNARSENQLKRPEKLVDKTRMTDTVRYDQPSTPPVRNQTAPQANTAGLHLIPVAANIFRRSSPEEDFLWTLSGVQNLIDQQNIMLSEFKCKLATQEESCSSNDGLTKLAIPRPRIVMRDSERMERRREEMERRRLEMESLRQFQERMEQKLEGNEKVLYEVCDL